MCARCSTSTLAKFHDNCRARGLGEAIEDRAFIVDDYPLLPFAVGFGSTASDRSTQPAQAASCVRNFE